MHSNPLLSGTVPDSLGSLVQLEQLDLSADALSGTVPSYSTAFRLLNISHNKITSWATSSLCGYPYRTMNLDVSGNLFVCPLPACSSRLGVTCTPPATAPKAGLSTWSIVGVVIACCVVFVGVAGVCYWKRTTLNGMYAELAQHPSQRSDAPLQAWDGTTQL
eukprot:TRINITY_DN2008_c0_g1_i64.p1 TRINITY_DN2008_c0_g1~~TRINITY_DN2008_c0_g1_i64.p1  ORF type:complete len:162 (+),score=25.07 TRINITY_DN2008_c0_g1_i64:358-843(+)